MLTTRSLTIRSTKMEEASIIQSFQKQLKVLQKRNGKEKVVLRQKQEVNLKALREENDAIQAQFQAPKANIVPTQRGATKLEHSSHETNHHAITTGQSQQKSYGQPTEACHQHLFVILDIPLPLGWRPLNIYYYNGTTDPNEHIEAYVM